MFYVTLTLFSIYYIQLVAEIIQRPERAHWKNCLLSDSAESNLAENFRENFHAYDFTLK